MIVVDTQMLVYLTTRGPFAPVAKRVAAIDGDWYTTTLWRSEFRSVMAGEIRRGNLTYDRALEAFLEAEVFLFGERAPDVAEVLSLVELSTCTAYDLEFVAVAIALRVPLVTSDKQVLAGFPALAISPEAFAA